MKRVFVTAFFYSLLCNTSSCQTTNLTVSKSGRRLVWHDEFNYNGLPDSTKWSYEKGMNRGVQKQYYTQNRIQNAKVENGILTITARKEPYLNPTYEGYRKKLNANYNKKYGGMPADSIPAWARHRYDSIVNYTSASLITLGKVKWRFGRVEIRAKLPRGNGISSAIWMMGTNIKKVSWPACGEIDIVEAVGRQPNKVSSAIHFQDIAFNHNQLNSNLDVSDVADSFHIYTLDWNSDSIKTYIDGMLNGKFEIAAINGGGNNPFHKPFYLLISLALGSGSWGGRLDDSVLPQSIKIDYVRIYQ